MKIGWIYVIVFLLFVSPVVYFNLGSITGATTKIEYLCGPGEESKGYLPQVIVYKETKGLVQECKTEKPYCNPVSAAIGVIDCCKECVYKDRKVSCRDCEKKVEVGVNDESLKETIGQSIDAVSTTEWWSEEKNTTNQTVQTNATEPVQEEEKGGIIAWLTSLWGKVFGKK